MTDDTPLTFADLRALIDKLARPPLPADATMEERALRRILDEGRASLSPVTLNKLREALLPPAMASEWLAGPWASGTAAFEPTAPLLGAISLEVDPLLADGYLFVVSPTPDPPPDEHFDWKVRWALIRDIASAE